jgi:competence ComEA-like helix-hairpin-helix protein
MNLFFKRRSIKKLSGFFSSRLTGPSFLKIALLPIILGTTFYFRFWAEAELPLFSSSSTSARVTAKESVFSSGEPAFPQEEASSASIDINTASSKELESLPGIGPRLAEEIVQDRLKNGLFHQATDLLRVKGIGPKKASRIESYLRFKD